MNKPNITCITFIRAEAFSARTKAFFMMQFAHKHLRSVSGLQFYKLMGTGKGDGFNPFPDWSTYSLLTVWDSMGQAIEFVEGSELYGIYHSYAEEVFSVFMQTIMAHGEWSGKVPFFGKSDAFDTETPICVITRATIKTKYLLKFWRYVPTSSKGLETNTDLIFTKGIGEVPVRQMATFSIWKNVEAMKAFAYNNPNHQKAIQYTRTLGWYSEELFARFLPIHSIGTWQGQSIIQQ